MGKESKRKKPSELELQVLGVLWERGEATTRDVLEALPDGKPRAYTTVLSIMQVMEKKALLTRSSEGVAHIWGAAVTRNEVTGPLVRDLVRNVFGGNSAAVVQQLLGGRKVSSEELAEIQRLLDSHSTEAGKSEPKRSS
ncbi:MAG: BlaI/MecI/CopY family transcriptional regulator [Verrucomicrobiales bacterium]|nr:BlaI/MecI/CopY family transcriptional regulator [Verrucomicrobiales bacterium]